MRIVLGTDDGVWMLGGESAERLALAGLAVCQDLRASPLLPGFEAVRIPGQDRLRIYQERMAKGIPIHAKLLDVLRTIAAELNISALPKRPEN